MMTDPTLRCAQCAISLRVDMTTLACPDCGRPLDVDYPGHDYGSAIPPMPAPKQFLESSSLGEGNTPIVSVPSIASQLSMQSLDAKLEYINPTGSFKDRGTAVVIAAAKQHGVSEVVEDSSGNAGASVSAYAARAGMKAPHLRSVVRPSGKAQADRCIRSAGSLHPRPARGNDRRRHGVRDRPQSGVRFPRP